MFNIEEIKELMALLENSSLSALEVQQDDVKVRLEKPAVTVAAPVAVPAPAPAPVAAPAPADAGKAINAPIVGVFYAAPSPDSEPYVSVGKRVKKGDVVCIIEAMKCMNEIQAEEDGEITAVLATNGELVEYGQPLFAIK
ncbi:acetyl-CoA carboxylase biotin carboxyl carrier protein [Ruminococcaceae bacterium P7]|nr:acetyl-CoA carboxylase biotin carboxyl carrier protein [Ruminococcaceae bacterium P7]